MILSTTTISLSTMGRFWTASVVSLRHGNYRTTLRFLDKYASLCYGKIAIRKYLRTNRNKTLLDLLTVQDIAFAILNYENSIDKWTENWRKKNNVTEEADASPATLKYHKEGCRIPAFQDSWTEDGRVYFKKVCAELTVIKTSDVWNTFQVHWGTYTEKYHSTSYKCASKDTLPTVEDVDDANCIISLPGEV